MYISGALSSQTKTPSLTPTRHQVAMVKAANPTTKVWVCKYHLLSLMHVCDGSIRAVSAALLQRTLTPDSLVIADRNLVKALSWYKDVGEKLSDPAYSGWFLQFDSKKSNYSSPPCA